MSDKPTWLGLMPRMIRQRIQLRPDIIKMLINTGWLLTDKILRMGVGLIVGIWVARHLGPASFGLLNYATAVVALFTAVASLGLNKIVVRDLVKEGAEPGIILGSAVILQIIGGLLACMFSVIAVEIMRPKDNAALLVVLILGLSLIFKASEVIKYWFESLTQSKYSVWAENGAFLIFSTIKVALITTHAPLIYFAWAITGESAIACVLLFAIYHQNKPPQQKWLIKIKTILALLRDSWPLILSGLAAMIYMRIDQIMIGQMLDDSSVGTYSAALRLSEVWYFIPMTIVGSVFPTLVKIRETDSHAYHEKLQRLFKLMTLLAVCVAIPISFLGDHIVKLLYGDEYNGAAGVLIVHIWGGIFVFSGVASSCWFVSEGLQKYAFYRTLAGCLISVALNYYLIPSYGILGAAWASVLSQAVASVFYNALNKKTRALFHMQVSAFFLTSKKI